MLKLAKNFVLLCFHAGVVYAAILVSLRIWPDMKEKPPIEIFVAGFMGALAARWIFYVMGLDKMILGYWRPTPTKTDPVIGPASAPRKTYEEWKSDLDSVDGQDGLEEFLNKWSEVPLAEKKPAKAEVVRDGTEKGPSDGRVTPNVHQIPTNVVGWIDKHYDRASQLWARAHPGQEFPNPRRDHQAEDQKRWEEEHHRRVSP